MSRHDIEDVLQSIRESVGMRKGDMSRERELEIALDLTAQLALRHYKYLWAQRIFSGFLTVLAIWGWAS